MKSIIFIFANIFFACAHAYSGVGAAEVRDDKGVPCFSITAEEEADMGGDLEFGMVNVHQLNDEKKLMWRILTTQETARISFSNKNCLRYGEKISNTINMTPVSLELGKIYSVTLILYPQKNLRPHKVGNIANFCLSRFTDGSVKTHQVLWDKSAQRWRTEVCSISPTSK